MFLKKFNEYGLKDLFKLSEEEKCYKLCYEKYPFSDFALTDSWETFRAEYIKRYTAKHGQMDFNIPEEAPTPMEKLLTEENWLDNPGRAVEAFRHARYGPAFIHQLEFINIMYVMSGSCVIYDEKDVIETLNAGNLCIILPGIKHAVFCCHDDDIVINIITKRSTFETAFFSVLSEQNALSNFFWNMLYNSDGNKMMLIKGNEDEDIKNIVSSLYNEIRFGEPPSPMVQKSFLCILFGQICRRYENDICFLKPSREMSKRTTEIIRYIIENMRDVTLEQVAQHFKMSCGYISRYIVSETSMTFKHFLRHVRMEHAREMMENQAVSIEDVMYAVGYMDRSRFYRNFKKLYGCTPGEYRKGHKKPH